MALQTTSSFDRRTQTVVTVQSGQAIHLPADLTETSFIRDGFDLTLIKGSSLIVYKNFFAQGEGKPLPVLVFADGSTASGEEFLKSVNPEIELVTAPEPADASVASGGSGEYRDGAGDLFNSVVALGALDGLGRWTYESTPEARLANGLKAIVADGPSPLPGPIEPGPIEPGPTEPANPANYFARVILTNADAQPFSFLAHDENGLVTPGDAALSGDAADWFTIYDSQPDGNIIFGLTEAGRNTLANGEDIGGALIVTVKGVDYPVYVSGQGSASGYRSPADGGTPVSEWYESHGAVENADIKLGAKAINSVIINSDSRVVLSSVTEQEWIRDWDERYDPALDENGLGYYPVDVVRDATAVIGVRNNGIDAGNSGEVSIRASTDVLPHDPESPHVDLKAVYGVYGGAQDEVTSITGGSVTIGAQVTFKDAPPLDESPSYDLSYTAAGIRNQGSAVEYEYDENGDPKYDDNGNPIPIPGDPSKVAVTGRDITVQAEAEVSGSQANVSVTGIHNGSDGNAPVPALFATGSLAPPDASDGHTILRGQDGVSNTIIISATVEGRVTDLGTDQNSGHEIIATGIKNEGGRVDIFGGDKDDAVSIQAGVRGDFGDFASVGYTVYGIDVSDTSWGDLELPRVSIDGGAGRDTLLIKAEAVELLNAEPSSSYDHVYGVRASRGGLAVSNVEELAIIAKGDKANLVRGIAAESASHISITGAEEVTITAEGGNSYGILGNSGSDISITAGDADMTLRITSGGDGISAYEASSTTLTGVGMMNINAENDGLSATGYETINSITAGSSINLVITAGRYAMSADYDGRNIIVGSEGADYILLEGDIHAEHGGINRIITGGGADVVAINGYISGDGDFDLNMGDGWDVLVLQADSAAEFVENYGGWLSGLTNGGANNPFADMGIEGMSFMVENLQDIEAFLSAKLFATDDGAMSVGSFISRLQNWGIDVDWDSSYAVPGQGRSYTSEFSLGDAENGNDSLLGQLMDDAGDLDLLIEDGATGSASENLSGDASSGENAAQASTEAMFFFAMPDANGDSAELIVMQHMLF